MIPKGKSIHEINQKMKWLVNQSKNDFDYALDQRSIDDNKTIESVANRPPIIDGSNYLHY